MAVQVQQRRGTTAQHSTFTGAVAEITVDTDKDTAVVHDGSTAGGVALARQDLDNVALTSGNILVGSASNKPASVAMSGDVAISNAGVTTIAGDAVTYAKIQNISATDRLLGRSTAGSGDVEEITCTAAGRALLDDADAAAQRSTLGLKTGATTNITTSTSDPTGGADGDIWIKYTA